MSGLGSLRWVYSEALARGAPLTVVAERSRTPSAETVLETLPALVRERATSTPGLVAMREKRYGIWQEITWEGYWD